MMLFPGKQNKKKAEHPSYFVWHKVWLVLAIDILRSKNRTSVQSVIFEKRWYKRGGMRR